MHAETPAPAAPSVGEPEPAPDQNALTPEQLADVRERWLDRMDAANFTTRAFLDLPPKLLWDLVTWQEAMRLLRAECAALRSSLDEARKGSERWQWARERFKLVAMPADEFCPRPAAYLDAPDLMEFTMCDGTFETVDAIVDRARAAALARHLPPRAPSPRDEP